MIRPTTEADFDAIIELAVSSGLFDADQTEFLATMLRSPADDDVWFTDEESGVPVAVAFVAPEKMTRGTWNLYWIAVAPSHQRKGRGKSILDHVLTWLADQGQRLLIVETAGIEEFDYVRKFYADNGFDSEARIRDFYEKGVDKVVFRKSLT